MNTLLFLWSTCSLLLFFETVSSAAFISPSLRTKHYNTFGAKKSDNDKNVFNEDNIFNKDENEEKKLGIDIGGMLNPLTPEEAEALRAEASELISDKVAQGVDEIEALRKQLTKDLERQRQERLSQSERNAKKASKKLLGKIDQLTDGFLQGSESMRESTKRAAAADAAMEGKSVELGSWGTLGGAAVTTGLLGSVQARIESAQDEAAAASTDDTTTTTAAAPVENRILVLADTSQDPLAKALIPAFSEKIQNALAGVEVTTLKPSQTMPLGGDNAACVVCFATSISGGQSSLKSIFERLLRRTLGGDGQVGTPPSQLVCVSTLGTERTDKFPYSMQNVMGGKLDKRRQLEEVVINTVQQRVVEPPLDYTIVKVSEQLKDSDGFEFMPGDVLDGTTSVDLAAEVLVEAVAFQPAARNATLCVVGGEAPSSWEDSFLRLDGPEVMRFEEGLGDVTKFDQLNEYLGEWAMMMESGKKLTTPIRVETSTKSPNVREGVAARAGVRLVFLPTKTGSAYMSKEEERQRERDRNTPPPSGSNGSTTPVKTAKNKREGGVEVLVEVTTQDALRVRARRCNMADETVLKEISEATILKRLQDSIDVWKRDIL